MLMSWLLGGCSAVRLSYNQGPTLAYWWLDGYADFSADQAPRVRAALQDWFSWHRATQLPDYAQGLATLQTLAVDNVTAAQVCSTVTAWQRRLERAYDEAVPAIAEQLRTLTPAQIDHIERRQARKQEELAENYLQPDPAERHKAALARTVDQAELVYGTLSEGQRRQLAAMLLVSPFDAERWLTERRLRQADIVRRLRLWLAERPDRSTVQAGLRLIAAQTLLSPRADYQAYATRLQEANCALIARLHNGTTPAQRQRAAERLKGWEDDLRALAAP